MADGVLRRRRVGLGAHGRHPELSDRLLADPLRRQPHHGPDPGRRPGPVAGLRAVAGSRGPRGWLRQHGRARLDGPHGPGRRGVRLGSDDRRRLGPCPADDPRRGARRARRADRGGRLVLDGRGARRGARAGRTGWQRRPVRGDPRRRDRRRAGRVPGRRGRLRRARLRARDPSPGAVPPGPDARRADRPPARRLARGRGGSVRRGRRAGPTRRGRLAGRWRARGLAHLRLDAQGRHRHADGPVRDGGRRRRCRGHRLRRCTAQGGPGAADEHRAHRGEPAVPHRAHDHRDPSVAGLRHGRRAGRAGCRAGAAARASTDDGPGRPAGDPRGSADRDLCAGRGLPRRGVAVVGDPRAGRRGFPVDGGGDGGVRAGRLGGRARRRPARPAQRAAGALAAGRGGGTGHLARAHGRRAHRHAAPARLDPRRERDGGRPVLRLRQPGVRRVRGQRPPAGRHARRGGPDPACGDAGGDRRRAGDRDRGRVAGLRRGRRRDPCAGARVRRAAAGPDGARCHRATGRGGARSGGRRDRRGRHHRLGRGGAGLAPGPVRAARRGRPCLGAGGGQGGRRVGDGRQPVGRARHRRVPRRGAGPDRSAAVAAGAGPQRLPAVAGAGPHGGGRRRRGGAGHPAQRLRHRGGRGDPGADRGAARALLGRPRRAAPGRPSPARSPARRAMPWCARRR